MKITINESAFKAILEYEKRHGMRFLKEDDANGRLDKYGNPIPRNGQGWGKDPSLVNRQGYNQDGTKGPWFSRSVAVATAVLLHDTGGNHWYILANQRGSGAADYQGYWNLPCGYLDYNEEATEAAAREVREETGININPSELKYFGHSTSPNENRQNVIFFYVAFIEGEEAEYPFSKKDMEENEVDGIQWLPVEKAESLKWAFDHDELIQKILSKYSHLIMGENNTGLTPKDKISKAIELLRNGGDTDYAIEMLQSLL